MRHTTPILAALLCAASLSAAAQAVDAPSPAASAAPATSEPTASSAPVSRPWTIATSVYTQHFHYDPAHNDHQHMLAVEWRHDARYGLGFAVFDNSFNQPTQYVFASARFQPVASEPDLYIRLTGGIVHGYKGKYRNKVPLNSSGFSPIALPIVGYCRSWLCGEIVFFGTNGATALLGARF